MQLEVFKQRLTVNYWQLLRSAGYHQEQIRQAHYRQSRGGEMSFAKFLGGAGKYPRFHLYVQDEGERLIFNLHLDQKQPSYSGSHAHSGEYDGELVTQEIARLQALINNHS